MKKNSLITIIAVAVIALVALISFLARPQLQNTDASDAAGAKKIQDALLLLTNEQQYQPLCRNDISRLEQSGEFIKAVSKLSGGAPRFYRNEEEVTCPLDAVTPSPDCLAVKDLFFSVVYTCPAEKPISMTDGRNGLKMKNQVVGNAVIVDLVVLEHPGYVIVYSGGSSKTAEAIIGVSSWLPAGAHEIVSIAANKTLQTGKVYSIGLNADNGDRNYQESSDLPLTTPEGLLLTAEFSATSPKK